MNEYIFFENSIMEDFVVKDKETLLLQNARFYEAFENADIDALDRVWSHSYTVKCVHPGWHFLEGWDAIRESWEHIFQSGATMKISLRNISADVYGTLGIVLLIEELSYMMQNSVRTGAITTTNIFELGEDGWKMIHHHGSPMIVAGEKDSDDRYRYN